MPDLPDAPRVIVEPAKVHDYLLSTTHPVGRFKAAFFRALGYSPDRWEVLRDDLRAHARTGDVVATHATPFGRKFEVDGTLTGPDGRSAKVCTVWIVRSPGEAPRLVTAYPR